MKPGHWVLLVLGVLLLGAGVGLTVGGSALLAGDAAQRDGRYISSEQERLRTTGYALTSPSIDVDLRDTGVPGAPDLGDLASARVRAASAVPGQEVFIGVGEASAAEEYLRDVPHASVGKVVWSFGGVRPAGRAWADADDDGDLPASSGNRAPGRPGDQAFWRASVSGPGTQELSFDLRSGQWSIVVMNADATRPVWADLQVGVRSSAIGPVGAGLLAAGLIGLALGVPLLLLGAAGLGRDIAAFPAPSGAGPAAGRLPVRFWGFLDEPLSRGLWLIKWLMVVPHAVVLALLWPALVVTTVAAGLAILVTGRYPRSLFSFAVGVLRWTWRVGFYSYAALGTDRYPPFTLASAPYPADLDVAYPERLSRGLVLVKWWLLALPHLLVVAALTGSAGSRGAGVWWEAEDRAWGGSGGFSLLGLLVLVAAVILLFSGSYRRGLFDFVVGINRWAYRVGAYVLLLRDEYPPFRLDQGPVDPPGPRDPLVP
ncbi:hypothetical protein GCM10028789_00320 [Sinomonas halotolerans]